MNDFSVSLLFALHTNFWVFFSGYGFNLIWGFFLYVKDFNMGGAGGGMGMGGMGGLGGGDDSDSDDEGLEC